MVFKVTPRHRPQGDPCTREDKYTHIACGWRAADHKPQVANARAVAARQGRVQPTLNDEPCVGLDGEGVGHAWRGQGRRCTKAGCSTPTDREAHRRGHRYVYLAAVDETGQTLGEVGDDEGLSTVACFEFLLNLEAKRLFGYALGYDLTKILKDLPASAVYRLNRPDLRRDPDKKQPNPLYWHPRRGDPAGYKLNYIRGRMTIARCTWYPEGGPTGRGEHVQEGEGVTLWDVFRFFGCKFTTALTDWKVAAAEELSRMVRMKEQRGEFDRLTKDEVRAYCREECWYMGKLVRCLISAHEKMGLKLKGFFGAGSTAAALLTKIGIKDYIADVPDEMKDALARSFFGGRFELSRVGPIELPVFNNDISSAYPYQITLLPCLTHGEWRHVKGSKRRPLSVSIDRARLALVHVRAHELKGDVWGPFPWRSAKGTILFPGQCYGTWVWKDEYQVGAELFDVEATEAWVYHTDCDCKPFREIPLYYLERCRIGKEGPGIVIKLGINSCYGKLAQSVGEPQFQCWVWAANITSGCRAQLLRAFRTLRRDQWDSIIQFATDGVFSMRELTLPEPRYTGTSSTGKPLGGWECKRYDKSDPHSSSYPRGIMQVRPGVYFPLDPTAKDIDATRARGMSKAVLYKNADAIVEHWHRTRGAEKYRVRGIERFVGMVSGVYDSGANGVKRRADCGEWVEHPVDVSFDPRPKRSHLLPDNGLALWDSKTAARALRRGEECPAFLTEESAPYSRATLSPEALLLKVLRVLQLEQADGDFGAESFVEGLEAMV